MNQEEKYQTEDEIDLMDYVHPVRSPWQKKFKKFFLFCNNGV